MDNERFAKNTEYRAFMMIYQYLQAQEEKLEEDTKKCIEEFEKDIKKQQEEQKKLEMMREHPEWFEITSPKEYGMKLMKCKNKRK